MGDCLILCLECMNAGVAYTQAVNSNKRAAQSKVVRMMVSNVGQKVEEKYPQTQR